MPIFTYAARDRTGNLQHGSLEADSAGAVAAQLGSRGLVPTRVQQASSEVETGRGFVREVPITELLMFCRQMNTLLKAGVPILRSLAGLVDSIAHKGFSRIVADLKEGLEAGRELSQAMARHEQVFSPFVVAMVRVGESTGRLEEVFQRLYLHIDFQKTMREQVKAALRYPTFVIAAIGISLIVINVFVIPQFSKTFNSLGAELPLMTKILIGVSSFTVNWWPVLFGALAALVIAARIFVKTDAGGLWWDEMKLRLPIAGKIVRKATLARLTRSLGLALKSGLSIVQALQLGQQVVENRYFARHLEAMRQNVARGESVHRVAQLAGIFTPTVMQMILVGEESGQLDEMMAEVAEMYQRDVEYELKTLSAQIEPILIVFLGAIVLVLALGIFMPMWDLGSAMKGG